MFPVIDESCPSHFFINSFANHFSPSRLNCVFFLGIKRNAGIAKSLCPRHQSSGRRVGRKSSDLGIAERCLSQSDRSWFGVTLTALGWPRWVEKRHAPRVWNSETIAVVVGAGLGYLHERN